MQICKRMKCDGRGHDCKDGVLGLEKRRLKWFSRCLQMTDIRRLCLQRGGEEDVLGLSGRTGTSSDRPH